MAGSDRKLSRTAVLSASRSCSAASTGGLGETAADGAPACFTGCFPAPLLGRLAGEELCRPTASLSQFHIKVPRSSKANSAKSRRDGDGNVKDVEIHAWLLDFLHLKASGVVARNADLSRFPAARGSMVRGSTVRSSRASSFRPMPRPGNLHSGDWRRAPYAAINLPTGQNHDNPAFRRTQSCGGHWRR